MTSIYIVLLRAINAGGVNSLLMGDLALEDMASEVSGLIFRLAMPFSRQRSGRDRSAGKDQCRDRTRMALPRKLFSLGAG